MDRDRVRDVKVPPEFRPGDPIPGLADPPVNDGGEAKTRTPDFDVTPVEPPKEKERPARPKPRQPPLKTQLEDFFGGIAMLVMATGDEYCATHIATQAAPLAEAWAELAKKNERVHRMITTMLTGSAWGQVVFVTAATVIPIAAHHGLYPKKLPVPFEFGIGTPPPPSDDVRKTEKEKDK